MSSAAARANQQAALRRQAPLSLWTKSAYGTGQMVDAFISTAVNLFLFFYLSAVCGLSGSVTGAALFTSLVADAVIDPLVGSLSDNSRSRLGRRHPFLILSLPPLVIAFGLLFALPRGLSGAAAFAYVTAFSISLRAALSGFNVPYAALGAELTDDYVERSSVVSYRLFFGTLGSVICMALGPTLFFRGASGLLQRDAYGPFAWSLSALVVCCGAIAILGTLRLRDRLHQVEPTSQTAARQFASGLAELFRNRTFLALFATEVIYFAALGVSNTLTFHAYIFFWGMPQGFIQSVIIAGCVGTPIGVWLNTFTAARFEKRDVVMACIVLSALSQAAPPLLKIAGLAHAGGPLVYGLLMVNSLLVGAVVTTETIAFYSMIADASDEHEHRFGARREGLYFAGLSFAMKASSGLGSLVGGIALDLIRFPAGLASKSGPALHVAPEIVTRLGLIFGPAVAVFTAISALPLLAYRLDRAAYLRIQRDLRLRREAVSAAGT